MIQQGGDQFMRKSGGTRSAAIPWSPDEDQVLRAYIDRQVRIRDIADLFPGRTHRGVECRLWRLRQPPHSREVEDKVLLEQILVFCCRHNLSQRQFGAMAVGSPGFVSSIRKGRHIGEPLESRLREFMSRTPPRSRHSAMVQQSRRTQTENDIRIAKERLHRETDPHERAKTFIRQQGFNCFNAEILKPGAHGRFYVGVKIVSGDELLEFARRRGWGG